MYGRQEVQQSKIESFFGVFGYMNIDMLRWLYPEYYVLTATDVMNFCRALFVVRLSCKNCFLAVMGTAASVMVMALHIWHFYARDFQTQGRYIITVAFFGYVAVTTMSKMIS